MAALSLSELVQALANAVIDAQNLVENQQISLLSRFFDKDSHAPACLPITLPRMGFNDNQNSNLPLQVPLLSLVEPTMLHITEFQVSFDVELSGLAGDDGLDHAPDAAPAPPAPTPPTQPPDAVPAPSAASAPSAAPARTGRASIWRRLSRTPAAFGVPVTYPSVGPSTPGAEAPPEEDARTGPVAARALSRSPEADPGQPMPAMMVGLGPKGTSVQTAKATLKVSSRPMSDGMVRLINHLNKTF